MKRVLVAVAAFFVFMLSGCAVPKGGAAVSSLINQLPGVVQSINTLAQASPLDASTKEQLNGYVAWAEFIAKATGVVVGAVNPTGL